MKHLSLLPLALVLVLSACQPRDVAVVADEDRAKRGPRANSSNRESFLQNYGVAAHIVERQIEVLMAMEMLENGAAAEDQGFARSNGADKKRVLREKVSEKFKKSSNQIELDQWSQSEKGLNGHSIVEVFENPKESKNETEENAAAKKSPQSVLKLTETKSAHIKKVSDDKYEIEYKVLANVFKGRDSFTFETDIIFLVRKETKDGQQGFVIEKSVGVIESVNNFNKQSRRVFAKANEGLFISVNGCAYAEGGVTVVKTDREGKATDEKLAEIIFTKTEVKEKSNKPKPWSDPLPVCQNGKARPVLDYHRLLR